MALSLLERVKNKALEALGGVGNAIGGALGAGAQQVENFAQQAPKSFGDLFNYVTTPQKQSQPAPIDFSSLQRNVIEPFTSSVAKLPVNPALPFNIGGVVPNFNLGDVGNEIRRTAQAVPRIGAEAGLTLAGRQEPDYPQGLEKIFFGDQPLKNFNDPTRDSKNFLRNLGLDEGSVNMIAPAMIATGAVVDATPFAGFGKSAGKRAAVKAGEEILPKVIKGGATAIEDLAKLIPEGAKIAKDGSYYTLGGKMVAISKKLEQVAPEVVEQVKLTTDDLIKQAKKAGRTPPGGIPKTPKHPVDPLQQAIESGNTKPLNWYDQFALEPVRAIPKMLGDIADQAKIAVFEPLEKAKGNAVTFKNEYIKRVQEAVPFKAGSKESAAIQKFGEGLLNEDQLVGQFGDETALKIVQSNEFFRSTYDEILDTVNALRTEGGLPAIPKRDDYYRHFSEGGADWLDTLLTGNTGNSALSSSITRARKGEKTVYDAVAGFGDYIQKAGRAGYTDVIAPKVTKLADDLAKNGADPQVTEYLKKYASEGILGEKEARDLGKVGNAAANVLKFVGNSVKRNAVLFNARSLIMQTANVPTAMGQVLGTDAKGLKYVTQGLTNIMKNAEAMAQSPFLKDRGFSMPSQFVRPGKFNLNKIQNAGGKLLQQGDLLPTRYIWNTFYEQALDKKLPNAISYADEMAKKMIGGRGVGDLAPIQRSDLGTLAVPFGVEWANSAHALGDMLGKKQFGGLLATAVLYHGFNKVMEKTTGSPAVFDPIQTLLTSGEYATGSDKKEQNGLKAVGSLIAGMSDISPFSANLLSVAYPSAQWAGVPLPDSKDFFGGDDPTRFGTMSLYKPKVGADLEKTALGLFSQYAPTGGSQIKKTVEGLQAGARGYTESAAGNIQNAVPQDALSRAQMAVFGQWANDASREHFDSDFSRPLFDDERAALDALPAEAKPDFIKQLNESRREETAAEPDAGFFNFFGGGEEKATFTKPATTPAGAKAQKEAMDLYLENGGDATKISDEVIKSQLFPDKKDYQGNPQDDLAYYRTASLSEKDRLEALVGTVNGKYKDRTEMIYALASNKRKILGKSVMTENGADYLYDQGIISKDEKALLNAVKYDPLKDTFYMDRDYKGGSGSGGMTDAKRKAAITKLNSIFKAGTSLIEEPKINKTQPKIAKAKEPPKLNLKNAKKATKPRSSNQWFTPY